MKNTIRLFLILLMASTSLKAQKVYFIYLQTDNQQPFFARLGERVFNAGPGGFLIVPNLRDSTYSIRIGISGSQQPDLPYSITVNKKDQGFIIKDFGEKGWGLFNINSMAVIMPQTSPIQAVQTVKTEKRENNPFTDLLAKAADDSTIKEKPVIIRPEEKKSDPVIPSIDKNEEIKKQITGNEIDTTLVAVMETPKTKDTAIVKNEPVKEKNLDSVVKKEEKIIRDSIAKEELQQNPKIILEQKPVAYKRSEVKLKSESSTTMGIGLVFLDILSEDKTDTIKILIPPIDIKQPGIVIKQDEKKFLDIPAGDTISNQSPKVVAVNQSICRETATEEDFINLRRKMVGESNDDAMITEARKAFKTKCFTTQQIKNLSSLFLNDESKYKFFDASYGFVIDPAQFATLESELKDNYFINRFKAMLRL